MAKNPYDPFGSTEEPDLGFSYQPPAPGVPQNTGITGGAVPPGGQAAPPPPPPNFDRTAFRDKWMGSSGSFDDFIKANPEFSGVQQQGGGKGDKYTLPSGEIMDLQIGKGANGDNAAHGWTGVGEMHNGQASYYPPSAPAMGQFGGSQSSSAPASLSSISGVLQGLFPGGAFNQDVVNRRTENARENLARFQKSQSANDKAALASRGLIGSGPEISAQGKLSQDIADSYQNAASGIFADESQRADARMMQALQLATGMSESQAQQAIDWFTAQTGRQNSDNGMTLGLGNLALGNSREQNNYDLGRRGIDFNYDKLNSDIDNMSIDQLLEVLKQRGGGANIAAGGYQG